MAYAASRVLVTRTDSGENRFNASEFLGRGTGVAISQAWHPDYRTKEKALEKWGIQIGADAMSNIAKEFWPDVKRKLRRR